MVSAKELPSNQVASAPSSRSPTPKAISSVKSSGITEGKSEEDVDEDSEEDVPPLLVLLEAAE